MCECDIRKQIRIFSMYSLFLPSITFLVPNAILRSSEKLELKPL